MSDAGHVRLTVVRLLAKSWVQDESEQNRKHDRDQALHVQPAIPATRLHALELGTERLERQGPLDFLKGLQFRAGTVLERS